MHRLISSKEKDNNNSIMDGENEASSTTTTNSSSNTISLHIAAYENDDVIECEQLKSDFNGFDSNSDITFEYPRQQQDQEGEPDAAQLKANQKLLDSNPKKKVVSSPLPSSSPSQPLSTGPENADETKSEMCAIAENVRRSSYYHGLMPRQDIEPLLVKDGDFLLRKTEKLGCIILALAVRWNGPVKHFIVNQDKDNYYFEAHQEKSVVDLVDWHIKSKTPVSTTSGAKLKNPIERPPWILNHDSVRTVKKLGEGAFGEVYMAELTTEKGPVQCAVKTMREEISRDSRLKFMKEARLMRKFRHDHVVMILGIAVHEHPLMLLMELCLGGSVLSYLRKQKGKTTVETKMRFVLEASSGLAYLEEKSCIHRDIAARNCLLTEKHTLKISDFGMSSERKELTDEKLDKVPVKWLAPETMQKKIYSGKTDVWSYGVLCYEVFADGSEPYPGLTNIQTRAKIVVQNYRMEMPKDTPAAVSALVETCWAKEPSDRPQFAKIFETLSKEYKAGYGGGENKKDENAVTKKEKKAKK